MTNRFTRSPLARACAAALLVCAALPAELLAQASGAVSGRVTDARGSALPGARVSIPELQIETATNAQGEFSLPGVPEGSHRVEVHYLGLAGGTQTVTVEASQRSTLAVTLQRVGLEEISVTASPLVDGAARALNQQRMADNLQNVLSSDAIGRFPDPNIAEALQRVPGIAIERDQGEGRYINVRGAPSEFTAVSIDGVSLPAPDPGTRAVDLDTIPSDVVNALEVSKTLRPEQDADSVAGAVNIRTRSPFDYDGLRLRANGGFSHNDYGSTSDTKGSFVVSNLLGEDQELGLLLSASYSKTRRQVDNVESEWTLLETPEGDEVMGLVENLFKDYDTRRERIALTGMGEWRPSDETRAWLRGSYSRFTDDEYRNRLSIVWEDGDLQEGASDKSATFDRARVEKQFRHRVQRNEISTLAAGAEHELPGFTLDYSASLSRAEQTYPKRDELLFRSSLRPELSYDYSRDRDKPAISLFESGEHLQLDSYSFRENTFRAGDTLEDELALAANIEIPGSLGGNPASHKFGVKYRAKEKEYDEERWRDRRDEAAPEQGLEHFLGSERSDNYHYHLGNKMSSGKVRDYLNSVRALSRSDDARRMPQSITADYQVEEDITAAYGQTRLDLGNADLLLGARVEHTSVDGSAPQFNEDTGEISEGRASNSYTDWFPGATLRYAFNDQLIGRLALTRAINRPNYKDLVPALVETTDTSVVKVSSGNPDLKPLLSNNFDAALEYYIEPFGIVSAGVFYKDLSNYQFKLTLDGEYQGMPAVFTRPENAPDGHAAGFELNWQQQFSQLPGWAAGFGIFANYTYTDAEMKLGREYAGRSAFPLPGQSEHTYNLALFYEMYGFHARLSWTERSDYLAEINADDGRFDLYWEGRGQLDFTSSYQVSDNWELYLEAKNLTNSPGVRYYGSRDRVYEYEKFGYTAFLGARMNF